VYFKGNLKDSPVMHLSSYLLIFFFCISLDLSICIFYLVLKQLFMRVKSA
jgi:hypothetical protein